MVAAVEGRAQQTPDAALPSTESNITTEDVSEPPVMGEKVKDHENGVEFLIRRLQEAKATPASLASADPQNEGGPGSTSSSRIVTVTLAEIFAHQGEYAEAVRAYRRLIQQRPEDENRLQRRLAELEELAKLKKGRMGV
jgi:hypothetical protein